MKSISPGLLLFVVSGAREQRLHLPYEVARFFDLILSVSPTTRGDLSQRVSFALQIMINHGGLISDPIIHTPPVRWRGHIGTDQ